VEEALQSNDLEKLRLFIEVLLQMQHLKPGKRLRH
jgi:hypothetical protein